MNIACDMMHAASNAIPGLPRRLSESKIGHMTAKRTEIKRANLRYKPQSTVHALIDADFATAEFSPTISALIFDESFGGCGLVILDTPKLQVGDRCRIQIGNLPVTRAEVRWRRELAEDVIKIGVLFNE